LVDHLISVFKTADQVAGPQTHKAQLQCHCLFTMRAVGPAKVEAAHFHAIATPRRRIGKLARLKPRISLPPEVVRDRVDAYGDR
jgi:hypothetical protein